MVMKKHTKTIKRHLGHTPKAKRTSKAAKNPKAWEKETRKFGMAGRISRYKRRKLDTMNIKAMGRGLRIDRKRSHKLKSANTKK
jgi:hypothetical protein